MPFVSKSQERACWARYRQRVLSGQKIDWDCYEWGRHTDHSRIPERIYKKKSSKNSKKKKTKIYVGKRGGKYIIKSGNKIYLNHFVSTKRKNKMI